MSRFKEERQAHREAAAEMLEWVYRNRDQHTGPGWDTLTAILRHRIGSDGHADLSRDPDRRIEDLYQGLLNIAPANGCHWRSAIDIDTGRSVVDMQPGLDADYAACAADLAYGFNTLGWSDAPALLDRGGMVLMPCLDCERFGRTHLLQVRRRDDGYEVELR